MTNHENFLLNNQLCFALYASSNAITKLYNQKLRKLGLTYPQYLVLITLWEVDGLTVKALSHRLKLDSGTITPILKRLEKAGLLSRQRSQKDERSVNVTLTTTGMDMQRQVTEIQKKVACETGLSVSEFVELRSTLHNLLETMDTQLQETNLA